MIQISEGLFSKNSQSPLAELIAGVQQRLQESPAERSSTEDYTALPFAEFCERCLLIQNNAGELVPFKPKRAQLELVENLTGRDLVLKARQVGISTVIQAWLFYQEMQGGARTLTLCHDDELTSDIRAMADCYYENYPEEARPARKYANAKLTTYPDLNSRARIATVGGTAGQRKGRGGSNTHFHGSEVAFWPNASGVMSGAMQAGNPQIVLESTPNGQRGWFYERCMEALDKRGVWKLHFFPWWYEDEYREELEPGKVLTYTEEEQALVDKHGLTPEQIKWRRTKWSELASGEGGETFPQEYPEDPHSCFLASGHSYFGNIETVYSAPQQPEPQKGHEYVGGLDFGQADDYTVLIILDASDSRMVDMLRVNKESWQDMRRRVSIMANKWGARVIGEANSMGKTNTELLQSGELLKDGTLIEPVNLIAFDTTPASKPPLIQGLRVALHEEGLQLLNDPVLKHELRAYISKQTAGGHWTYEASEGAHDDTVIALALANRARHFGRASFAFV